MLVVTQTERRVSRRRCRTVSLFLHNGQFEEHEP